MQYCHSGKIYRESTGETDEKRAKKRLSEKLAEIRLDRVGKFDFVPNSQLRVRDLLDALEADYRLRKIKSIRAVISHLKPLKDVLGSIKAQELTAEAVDRYIEARLADRKVNGKVVKGRAHATCNRETQLLGQSFALAIRRKKLRSAPHIRRLSEKGNERHGVWEPRQLEALVKNLPQYLKNFVRFAYVTGWRKSEIASLAWQDVDLLGKVIRLRSDKSKNGTGRILALEGDLGRQIEHQWQMREYKNVDGNVSTSSYVFHRDGLPVGDIRRAWRTACKAAQVHGKIFHDFRRTAATGLSRAGVPERVAMAILGHKTRSMWDRYQIVSEDDLRQAIAKTQAHFQSLQLKEEQTGLLPERSSGVVA
jgi:integrase